MASQPPGRRQTDPDSALSRLTEEFQQFIRRLEEDPPSPSPPRARPGPRVRPPIPYAPPLVPEEPEQSEDPPPPLPERSPLRELPRFAPISPLSQSRVSYRDQRYDRSRPGFAPISPYRYSSFLSALPGIIPIIPVQPQLPLPEDRFPEGLTATPPATIPPPSTLLSANRRGKMRMSSSRESQFLDPASAVSSDLSRHKVAAIEIAKDQERAIHEKLRRNGENIPEYDFLELIGKGTYGRVFKAFAKESKSIVALKVMDVDDHDYRVHPEEKDESIETTLHEIKVLQQLKDSKARNVNAIIDAIQMHSQLWIVTEYCPGGSLHTLMRGTGDKLPEKYIIPIARELAEALKAIHEAGVIHRDIKSANVMIHENGKLQVIDFGIAGFVESKLDKRSTVIGTPHWMAPELLKAAGGDGPSYSTEVDVWAYGMTIYEIAMGLPAHTGVQAGRRLGIQLGRQPPRLSDNGEWSTGLRELVAFVCEPKPADRPSMDAILEHPYVKGSELLHPTESLAELVKIFYQWEHSGGQRRSLFIGGGAAAAQFPNTLENEEERWNFSTTATFEQQFTHSNPEQTTTSELVPDPQDHNIATADFASTPVDASNTYLHQPTASSFASSPGFLFEMSDQNLNPDPPASSTGAITEVKSRESSENMSPQDKAAAEARIKRGEKALQGLFDDKQKPYQYGPGTDTKDHKPAPTTTRPRSDLPLRDDSSESSIHHKELIITHKSDGTMELPNIDLTNNTIKPGGISRFLGTSDDEGDDDEGQSYAQPFNENKRATMDWTFPSQPEVTITAAEDEAESSRDARRDTAAWTFPAEAMAPQADRRDTTAWTFPSEAMASQTDVSEANVDISTPMLTRPTLRHTATAPAAPELRQSIGGMLDLDAIYDSEPYDSDLYGSDTLRTGAASDDDSFEEDSNLVTPVPSSIEDNMFPDSPGLNEPPSYPNRYPDSDDEYYEPFKGSRTDDQKITDEINDYLDENGVTDVMERAALRGNIMRSRKGFPSHLNGDQDREGLGQFSGRDWTPALGQYPARVLDPATWGQYGHLEDDDSAPYAMGDPARAGDDNFPGSGPLRTQFGGSSARAGGLGVEVEEAGNVAPPSAAAMRQDAPAHVVEGELRRLLVAFDGTLEALGEFFEAHRG